MRVSRRPLLGQDRVEFAKPVASVDLDRCHKILLQRPRRALPDQQPRRWLYNVQQAEQILRRLSHRHVPAHGGHPDDLQFGRGERQQQRQGVIDSWIGIENHFRRRGSLHA